MKIAALILAAVGLAAVVGIAQAGQPWWCVCNGTPKRFIASSHACEFDRFRKTRTGIDESRKIVLAPCTRTQWRAWNARACRYAGCRPPKVQGPRASGGRFGAGVMNPLPAAVAAQYNKVCDGVAEMPPRRRRFVDAGHACTICRIARMPLS